MFEEWIGKIRSWFAHETAWAALLALANLLIVRSAFDTDFLMGADEFSLQYDAFFVRRTSLFAWNGWFDLGHASLSVNNLPYVLFYDFFRQLAFSPQMIERILYFLLFFAGGYALFLLLARHYRIARLPAFAFALFYSYNLHYVVAPLAVNVRLVYIALPLAIIVIRKFLADRKAWHFAVLLPFALLAIAQASANPPAVSIVYLLILAYLLFQVGKKRLSPRRLVVPLLGAALFFLLFNAWWLSTLVPAMLGSASGIAQGAAAVELRDSPHLSLWNTLRFLGYAPWWEGEGYGHRYVPFAAVFENSPFLIAYSFLPPLIAAAVAFLAFRKRRAGYWQDKEPGFWIAVFLAGAFLAKGPNFPAGFLFRFLWDHVPGFWIFRDPWAKFTPLAVLGASVLGAQLFAFLIGRMRAFRWAAVLVAAVSVYCFALSPEIYYDDDFLAMRTAHVSVPDYWQEYSEAYAGRKLLMRNIALPKTYNGTHLFPQGFSGPLPFVTLASRQPLAVYPNFGATGSDGDGVLKSLYADFPVSSRLLGYLGAGYVTQQNDYDWLIGYKDTGSPRETERLLASRDFLLPEGRFGRFTNDRLDRIDLGVKGDPALTERMRQELRDLPGVETYALDRRDFLPFAYVPETVVATDRAPDGLAAIAAEQESVASAVLFRSQNAGKEEALRAAEGERTERPAIEFRQVDPAEYRLRVHGASGTFPLVLSEAYDSGWKAYLEKYSKPDESGLSADGYRVLDGNSDDQAGADELKDYVAKGWVTDLGQGNAPAFVSKDFQGTIQNDNLPGGPIGEAWLVRPAIDESGHLEANGYANAWLVDPEALCQGNGDCWKNADGSYDFELAIRYLPQRAFAVSQAISLVSVILAAACLFGPWIIRQTRKMAGKTIFRKNLSRDARMKK